MPVVDSSRPASFQPMISGAAGPNSMGLPNPQSQFPQGGPVVGPMPDPASNPFAGMTQVSMPGGQTGYYSSGGAPDNTDYKSTPTGAMDQARAQQEQARQQWIAQQYGGNNLGTAYFNLMATNPGNANAANSFFSSPYFGASGQQLQGQLAPFQQLAQQFMQSHPNSQIGSWGSQLPGGSSQSDTWGFNPQTGQMEQMWGVAGNNNHAVSPNGQTFQAPPPQGGGQSSPTSAAQQPQGPPSPQGPPTGGSQGAGQSQGQPQGQDQNQQFAQFLQQLMGGGGGGGIPSYMNSNPGGGVLWGNPPGGGGFGGGMNQMMNPMTMNMFNQGGFGGMQMNPFSQMMMGGGYGGGMGQGMMSPGAGSFNMGGPQSNPYSGSGVGPQGYDPGMSGGYIGNYGGGLNSAFIQQMAGQLGPFANNMFGGMGGGTGLNMGGPQSNPYSGSGVGPQGYDPGMSGGMGQQQAYSPTQQQSINSIQNLLSMMGSY